MSSISIGSNLSAMRAQRQLGRSGAALGHSLSRLSSGLRINRAVDDAAGLSVSTSLEINSRVFSQGIKNLNDGLSALHIIDGALAQLSGVGTRLQELATQAANGTYSAAQRDALDSEAQALSDEYSRIVQSTEFNGLSLLDGSIGEFRLQGGYGLEGGLQISLQAGGESSGVEVTTGTGTFTAATPSYTDRYFIALGDVNNDGVPDLVSTGTIAGVRLGVGDGSFGAKTNYACESWSTDVALGYINGDNFLDMVTCGRTAGYDGYATVRFGVGNGTFGTARTYVTESRSSYDVALGDLNGDGHVDLVTAGDRDAGAGGQMTVRLGAADGSGTFGAPVAYATDAGPTRGMALGYLNGDNVLDVVTAGDGAQGVTVRLGVGDGTFGAATGYARGVW